MSQRSTGVNDTLTYLYAVRLYRRLQEDFKDCALNSTHASAHVLTVRGMQAGKK